MPEPVTPAAFDVERARITTPDLTAEQRLTEPHDVRITGLAATPVLSMLSHANANAADVFASLGMWQQALTTTGVADIGEGELNLLQERADKLSDLLSQIRRTLYPCNRIPLSAEDAA